MVPIGDGFDRLNVPFVEPDVILTSSVSQTRKIVSNVFRRPAFFHSFHGLVLFGNQTDRTDIRFTSISFVNRRMNQWNKLYHERSTEPAKLINLETKHST